MSDKNINSNGVSLNTESKVDPGSFVLSCKDLTKEFKAPSFNFKSKKVEALKGVEFKIPKGSVCGLLGPNGSGKSTLLKICLGLIRQTQGDVSFFNTQNYNNVKNRIGFVPEKPEYPERFTAFQILNFFSKFSTEAKSRVNYVLDLVGLEKNQNRAFGGFSKGMKQRLAIGKALLLDPDFLILDEPLSGLDPDGREALIQVIESYAKLENKSVLLSSHLLEDVQRICNYLLVLKDGELVFKGSPFSVMESERYVLRFKEKNGRMKEVVSDAKELLSLLKHNIDDQELKLFSIQPDRQPLSELYFNFMNNKSNTSKRAHENHL